MSNAHAYAQAQNAARHLLHATNSVMTNTRAHELMIDAASKLHSAIKELEACDKQLRGK